MVLYGALLGFGVRWMHAAIRDARTVVGLRVVLYIYRPAWARLKCMLTGSIYGAI